MILSLFGYIEKRSGRHTTSYFSLVKSRFPKEKNEMTLLKLIFVSILE